MTWREPRWLMGKIGHQGVDHEGVFEIGAPPLIELEALLFGRGCFDWWDVEAFVGGGQNGWILMAVRMMVMMGCGWFGGRLVAYSFRGACEHLDNMFEVCGVCLDKGCWVGIGVRSGSCDLRGCGDLNP